MIIRKEQNSDIDSITEVTIAAFKNHPISRQTEQFIVNALRRGNALSISLVAEINGRVVGHIAFSPKMDAYLDNSFMTYKGVPELIDWCANNEILFMINTTGLMGYFQRVFAKKLLPEVPVISANIMIRYPSMETDPPQMYDLNEIQDKGINTAHALKSYDIPEKKIVIIGDSGGDGPHFEWGKKHQAYMIGSMAKQSLMNYCNKRKIEINLLFGPAYADGEERIEEDEMLVDFMELSSVFERILE